ncbi:hypothetical protein QQF64_014283 [Cirrhinus molitorella]|uniref:Uncharacterized protein n=1 Tax=Cirrhinus molitorella TaxID=172907 RepID=A0ABR3NSM5_9TELE
MERKRRGAERERIKRKKALATDAASCCKIPAMFASKGTGDEGSSSSTSAADAPAVELEEVDSSAFGTFR